MPLVDDVLAAYGVDQWRGADRLMVIFSAGGVGLAPSLRRGAVRCRTGFLPTAASQPPSAVLDPYPAAGSRGVLGGGEARLLGPADEVVAARPLASAVAGLARPGWDELSVLAFAAGTLWTWIALPFLLDAEDVLVRERAGRRLEVELPPAWPATASRHALQVDPDGRIVRHRETWSVRGRHVGVHHELGGHCDFGGVLVATTRRSRLIWTDVVAAALIPKIPSRPLN